MVNFIDRFLEYRKYAESPTSYLEFAALTSIAAVLRDNVYLKYQLYNIYPNIYTILLSAESSNTRKSVPLNTCKSLVTEVDNTHMISGTATMPAIFQQLAENYITKQNKPIEGASGIIIAPELTAFIKKDFAAVDHLTNLYDYHDELPERTKIGGVNRLKRVCLTTFAGTNEALISDLYDERAKDGGLLARSCIIYEKNRRFMNSMEYEQAEPKIQKKDLVSDLLHMSTLRGPIRRHDKFKEVFDHWYTKGLTDDKLSKSGAEGRIHDIARKLALLLCIAECPPQSDLVVTGDHMEKAIDYAIMILKNQRTFTMGAGAGLTAKAGSLVLKALYYSKEKKLTEKKLLQLLLGDVDRDTLLNVTETLMGAGYVDRYTDGDSATIKLTEEFLNSVESNHGTRKS